MGYILVFIVILLKVGSAKVTNEELCRLEEATRFIEVDWNVAEKPVGAIRFRKRM